MNAERAHVYRELAANARLAWGTDRICFSLLIYINERELISE